MKIKFTLKNNISVYYLVSQVWRFYATMGVSCTPVVVLCTPVVVSCTPVGVSCTGNTLVPFSESIGYS